MTPLRTLLPLSLLLAACTQEYDVVPGPVDVDPAEVTSCGFSQVGDTDFFAYDCNPVFTTTGEDWASSIGGTAFVTTTVLGHPMYQLWYVGLQSDRYALGYAISNNGTDWTPSPANPVLGMSDSSAWDADGFDVPQVLWDADTAQYVMLYQGYNIDPAGNQFGMGVGTSTNGVDWARLPLNPVVNMAVAPAGIAQWCWPLGLSRGRVAGFDGYLAGSTGNNAPCEVYKIGAPDITDWQVSTEVVLPAGPAGSFDDMGYVSLATAQLDQKEYMFYVGFGGWLDIGNGVSQSQDHFVGMATYDNGRWVREPGPLPLNRTASGDVSDIAANTVGSRIHLWITDDYDGQNGIGYFLYDPNRSEDP